MRKYFKFFHNYADAFEKLSDAEVGRLVRAMIVFSETGERPELDGNERFVFPMIANNIAMEMDAYDVIVQRNRINGEKGGRPKSKENQVSLCETQNTQSVFEEPKNPKESQEKEKEKEKEEEEILKGEKSTRFSPPTIEDISAYCRERKNNVSPQRFYDFYQSKGWMVGKNKMKDWRASVRTWEREKKQKPRASYDLEALDKIGLEIPEI